MLFRSEPVAVLGLGEAEAVDRLEVTWPDGEISRLEGPIPAGRIRIARPGESSPDAASVEPVDSQG